MKIGLFGYGKMGKAIERLAPEHGVEIVWRVTRANRHEFSKDRIREADVVIEFTRPESGFENVMACLAADVPVVSGTTGWNDQLDAAQDFCLRENGAFLWASNFSVGVNIFFALNRFLAKIMADQNQYDAQVTEIHHIHKLDAPSGTAVSLAKGILAEVPRMQKWVLNPMENNASELPIFAHREGEVPGTHSIRWASGIDEITIEHKANSRDGFAAGALLAAKWLQGRQGVFTMLDVLGFDR